jgi:bifunctional DNase/RNase
MAALVRSPDGHIDVVEVTDVNAGAFLARLALHGPAGKQGLDVRPSDGIALAVRVA